VKLLFSLILGCSVATGASLGITVRVLNLAHVPARTLSGAQATATGIFKRSGVDIAWVDCGAPDTCKGDTGPTEFWLQLLEKPPATFRGDIMGFALLTHLPLNDGGYAAVSWQAVRVLVDSMKVDSVPVMGAAIAHELGHLLLGSHQHSRDGVMASRLGRAQLALAARGGLMFNDAQGEAIRREIQRRGEQ